MQAADEGKLLEGLQSVGRMASHLPWSAPSVVRGLVLAVLGPKAYVRLALARSAGRAHVAALGGLIRGGSRGARAEPPRAAGARPTLTLAPASRRGGSDGLAGVALTHGIRPAAWRSANASGSSGHFGRGIRVNGTLEKTSGGAT